MILQDDPRVVHPRSEAALEETLTEDQAAGHRPPPRHGAVEPDRPGPAQRAAAELRRDRSPRLPARSLGPLRPDRPDRRRARPRRAVHRQRPGAGVGGRGPRAGGPAFGGPTPARSATSSKRSGTATRASVPILRTPPPRPLLPRVDHWSVYNEPNFPGWLMPQFSRGRPRLTAPLPRPGGRRVGGARDSPATARTPILLGETARFGEPRRGRRFFSDSVAPAQRFVRELYCLSERYRPLRGRAARARGCPATAAGAGAFGPTTRACSMRPAGPTTRTRSPASRPGRATGPPTP